MPQDEKTKHAYEHADQVQKQARADDLAEADLDSAILHAQGHAGQQGVLPANTDSLDGADIKKVYELLPDWHRDELRRLQLVPPGTRLKTGGAYLDLRDPQRGELIARGEETVGEELLVAKHDVDYEIWNKLRGR